MAKLGEVSEEMMSDFESMDQDSQVEVINSLDDEDIAKFDGAYSLYKQRKAAPSLTQGTFKDTQSPGSAVQNYMTPQKASWSPASGPQSIGASAPTEQDQMDAAAAIPEGTGFADSVATGIGAVTKPIRENLLKPVAEQVMSDPVGELLKQPMGGPVGTFLRATDRNPQMPPVDKMGSGEILARQAMAPIVGNSIVPGGVNVDDENSADSREAAVMANTLENDIGPWLGPAASSFASHYGELPYWLLGGKEMQSINKAVEGSKIAALTGKEMLPTLLRHSVAGAGGGFVGGGAQGALAENPTPFSSAAGGAAGGALLGPVVGVVGEELGRAVSSYKAGDRGTNLVLGMFRTPEQKLQLKDSLIAFSDSELGKLNSVAKVTVDGKVTGETAPIPFTSGDLNVINSRAATKAWKSKIRPALIQTYVDEKGNFVSRLVEFDVTNPTAPRTVVQNIVSPNVREAMAVWDKHPGAFIEHGDGVLPAKIDEMVPGKIGSQVEDDQVPVVLMALSTGEKTVAVPVPISAPSVHLRAPGDFKMGDAVKVPAKFVKGGVEGVVIGVDGNLVKIKSAKGKVTSVPRSLVTSIEALTPEAMAARKQILMAAQERLEMQKGATVVSEPDITAVDVNPLNPAQRQAPVTSGFEWESPTGKKNTTSVVRNWSRITPERMVETGMAKDLSDAAGKLEWMRENGYVKRSGNDAVYVPTNKSIDAPSAIEVTKNERGAKSEVKSAEVVTPVEAAPQVTAPVETFEAPVTAPTREQVAVEAQAEAKVAFKSSKKVAPNGAQEGMLVAFRTPEMRAEGVDGRQAAVKEIRSDGSVVLLESDGTTHIVSKHDVNSMFPVNMPEADIRDVMKQDIPGVTTPLDLDAWTNNPQYADVTLAGIQRALKQRGVNVENGMSDSARAAYRRIIEFTGGFPQDTRTSSMIPGVVQGLRGGAQQDKVSLSFVDAARKVGLGPHTEASMATNAMLEAVDSASRQEGYKAWAAKYPQQAKKFGESLVNLSTELRGLQEQLAVVGVDTVALKEWERQLGNEGEFQTAVYRAFQDPEKWMRMLVKEMDNHSRLTGPDPKRTPVLKEAIDFFQKKTKKAPERIVNDILEILRHPDSDLGAQFKAKGYVSSADAAKLKERRVWDTPELKAIKNLLGPETDPIIRLAHSTASANALLTTVKASNALVETPFFSREIRGDLTYKIPDAPQYGNARGGYTHPELKPFIEADAIAKQSSEMMRAFTKGMGVWKMSHVALGGFAPWVSNMQRLVKNLIFADGPLLHNSKYFYDAVVALKAMHSDPSIFGKARPAREAIRVGVLNGGMASNEFGSAKNDLKKEMLAAAAKEMELSGDGGFWGFISGVSEGGKLKGSRALRTILEMYDLPDQVAKLATYMKLKDDALRINGGDVEKASVEAAAAVLRYFPDYKYVPPIVSQTRTLQGPMISAFISAKANDWRINMNAAQDIGRMATGTPEQRLKGAKLMLRSLAASGVAAGAYAGLGVLRRGSGYSDDEMALNERNLPTQEKMTNPARVHLPGDWGRNSRGNPIRAYIDVSNLDDITMGLRAMNPNVPAFNQAAQWLAWQATDAVPMLGMAPVMQTAEFERGNDPRVIQGQMTGVDAYAGLFGKSAAETMLPQAVYRWMSLKDKMADKQPLTSPKLPASIATLKGMGIRINVAGTPQQATAHGLEMQQAQRDLKGDVKAVWSASNKQQAGKSAEQKKQETTNRIEAGKLYFQKQRKQP